MSDLSKRIAALTPAQRQALLAKLKAQPRAAAPPSGPPLERRPAGAYPASRAQEHLWFVHALEEGRSAYCGSTALRFAGPLDRAALARSIAEVVARHEVLRSTFEQRDGTLVQVPGAADATVLRVVDLSTLPPEEREPALRAEIEHERDAPFDLGAGPLFRALLVASHEEDHVLVLSAHHILADGWSLGLLTGELSALYAAFREGASASLPQLAVQFGDYARWERERLQEATAEGSPASPLRAGLDYWRRTLKGLAPFTLPLDRPRGRRPNAGAEARRVVSPAVTSRVRSLSRDARATPFMTLLAAFQALLFRYTGHQDIAVGSPVANRTRAELEPLIGLFANLVVLRTPVSGRMRFEELLGSVSETCVGAFEHQEVPFGTLVEELSPSRDVTGNPLVQVTFAVQTPSLDRLALPGITVTSFDIGPERARFDLELHVWDRDDVFELVASYNGSLFDTVTVTGLLERYVRVLDAVTADPDCRLDEIPLVSSAERAALVSLGAGRATLTPRDATLASLFLDVAHQHAASIAIEDGDVQWTYDELEVRASRYAQALLAAGVGPNVAVGLWLERGAELMACITAVALAGGAYVPLEPGLPAERAVDALSDSGARVLLTTEALRTTCPSGSWQIVTVEQADTWAPLPRMPIGHADDLAYVMYTSGSTGRPKGVAVPQRAIVRLVKDPGYVTLTPATVLGQAATVAFDAATFEIWGALLNGGRLVIVPTAVAIAPRALGAYLQRTGVTTLWLTSSLYNAVVDVAPAALRGVTQLVIGGEALSVAHVRRGLEALPGTTIVNGYGPTENTTFTCCYAIPRDTPGDAVSIPIGGPIAETTCYVVEGGDLAAPGVPGELYVGGSGLAQGYVGSPRLTAERFVPDPFSGVPGARLYRTGDLVRWTESGVLEFLGRRDGQIKLRGYRIELGEVDAALCGVDGVAAAAAVTRGEGANRQLMGYVVPAAGAVLDGARVRAALRSRVPGYMVPAAVSVIDALPLTPNGKVDRAALPDVTPDASASVMVAPRSVREAQIAAVWKEVLDRDAIGVEDGFFEVGGHSLLLMTLQARLESALGTPLPLVTLFQYPTIAALAAYLDGETEVSAPVVVSEPSAVDDGIAVIGLAGRFPGAPNLDAFWDALCEGRELIRHFTRDELMAAGVPPSQLDDPRYVPAKGALDGVAEFDAQLFGYTPREATLLDPQQRIMLECAWTALEHAGYAPLTPTGARIGIYAGTSQSSYFQAAGSAAVEGIDPLERLIASDKDFLATRVSYKLHLRGPAVTVQTACSTSLVAVHAACQALRAGECEVALAGGVSVTVPPVGGYLYQREGIASPDGHCRPFDASASGTVGGNGVGMVVLKPLRAALAAGDTVYAVIRGTAINNDGAAKVGFTAPSVAGQAAVVAAAQAAAGVAPETIGYVEGHGTGTALGDPIEVAALRQVFGEGAGPGTCALGSVKGHVGHLDAAAGVTGLITTVLALRHGTIPPTLHFTAPSPQVALGPFRVPTSAEPWPRGATPRRAGVSSFGMGGTNAHAVLEEAPPLPDPTEARTWHVMPVSGQTAGAVAAAAEALATTLTSADAPPLAEAAYTQQVGRAALPVRRVAVGQTAAALAAELRSAADTVVTGTPPVVWVFPGQGTQLLRMAQVLDATEPIFRAELDACAAVVQAALGTDLRAVLYPTTETEAWAAAQLRTTTWTQVALVAVELALAAQWRAWGVRPAAVVGHSVGELAAACVAGVLTREGALRLAASRGTAMAAAPAGGMVAIPAAAATIAPRLGPDLWLAADNRATQCVVAGTDAALDALLATLTAEGVRPQRLPAAGAFHSGLMATAVEPITAAAAAESRQAPQIAWVSTLTATVLTADAAQDPAYWGRQVVASVRWREAVTAAAEYVGAPAVWLEIGPGHTLTHLVRGTTTVATTVAPLDPADAGDGLARGVGALWAAGVVIDWAAYHAGARRQRVALPTYPFQRQRYWLEPASDDASRVSASHGIVKHADIGRWFYTPGWVRAPLEDPASTAARRALVFADASGVAAAAIARLRAAGHHVVEVEAAAGFSRAGADRFTIDPRAADDYAALLRTARAEGDVDAILHCWDIDGRDDALASVLLTTQAVVEQFPEGKFELLAVTEQAHDVVGTERVRPDAAPIGALCRVVSQEHPRIACRTVDVSLDGSASNDAIGAQLAAELLSGSREGAVSYRAAARWIETFTPRYLATRRDTPRLFRQRGVYLITGGRGRIGLAIARALARTVAARLILLGRSTGDAAAGIDVLEREGAEVVSVTGDVSNPDDLRRVLATIDERFGALHGVIHAAGVTAGPTFAPVRRLGWPAFETQFRAKVEGTRALAAALDGRPLDFCLLASSLSTVLGGLEFGAYAAANAWLDAFAASQSAAGSVPWISVDFDGWVFDESRAAGAAARLGMTPAEGVDALIRILDARPLPRTVVSTADLGARRAQWIGSDAVGESSASAAPPATHVRVSATEYVEPRTATERDVARIWAELIGVDRVGAHDDFFALGGHSLLGTQIMSRIRDIFDVDLSLAALFGAPTVAALSVRIDDQRSSSGASAAERLLHRVRSMSPEERQRMLDEARHARSVPS